MQSKRNWSYYQRYSIKVIFIFDFLNHLGIFLLTTQLKPFGLHSVQCIHFSILEIFEIKNVVLNRSQSSSEEMLFGALRLHSVCIEGQMIYQSSGKKNQEKCTNDNFSISWDWNLIIINFIEMMDFGNGTGVTYDIFRRFNCYATYTYIMSSIPHTILKKLY